MGLNLAERKAPKAADRVPQPNLEPGGHAARVVQVIDLGLQPQKPYKGTVKAPVDMIYITYELSHDFMLDKDGNPQEDLPRWLSEDFPAYSLDQDKAKSTLRYNAIDPKQEFKGDFSKILGMPCTVVVVQNAGSGANAGKVYDNVGSVTAAMKVPGYVQPPLVNPAVFFDLTSPDLEVFTKLPAFLQDRIKGNLNYQGSALQALLGEAGEAPVPTPNPAAGEAQGAAEEPTDDNPY